MILLAILAVIGVAIAGICGFKMWQQNQLHTSASAYYVQVDVNNRAEALLPMNVDGEFTLKYLRMHDGGISLVPANEKYPVIEVGEGTDFKMWGVVTYVIKKVR